MMRTHTQTGDETTTRYLPGATRFLAISAAYLAVTPAAVSGNASNGYATGTSRSVAIFAAETTGARL